MCDQGKRRGRKVPGARTGGHQKQQGNHDGGFARTAALKGELGDLAVDEGLTATSSSYELR